MRAIVSASTIGEITSASPGTHLRRDSLQLTDTKLFTVSNHETVVNSPWSFSVGDPYPTSIGSALKSET